MPAQIDPSEFTWAAFRGQEVIDVLNRHIREGAPLRPVPGEKRLRLPAVRSDRRGSQPPLIAQVRGEAVEKTVVGRRREGAGTVKRPSHCSHCGPIPKIARGERGGRRAFTTGQMRFADGTADLADRCAFTGFLSRLRTDNWIVYAKAPFAGPEQVLRYLGCYTHRVALSNDRLVEHGDGHVRFRWKDYADHDRVKILTLETVELLRRFLLHVVPRGFMRIRHFGLLANRTRRQTLTRCRRLLGQLPTTDAPSESATELMHRLTGIDLGRCPVCGEGRMHVTAIVGQVTPFPDTS